MYHLSKYFNPLNYYKCDGNSLILNQTKLTNIEIKDGKNDLKNNNICNSVSNDSKSKTIIEYNSDYDLFSDGIGITYRPGFVISFSNYKNQLFANKKIGFNIHDVFGFYTFSLGYANKKSSKYNKLVEKDIEIYNLKNQDFKFDYDISKSNNNGFFLNFSNQLYRDKKSQKTIGFRLTNYDLFQNAEATFFNLESTEDKYDLLYKFKIKKSSFNTFENPDKESEFLLTVYLLTYFSDIKLDFNILVK